MRQFQHLNVERVRHYRTTHEMKARLPRVRLLEHVAWERFYASLSDGTHLSIVRAFMRAYLNLSEEREFLEQELAAHELTHSTLLAKWVARRQEASVWQTS